MENNLKENIKELEKIEKENIENKKEEDFSKKLEANKLTIMTSFNKIKNTYSDGIMHKIKNHKKSVNNSVKLLIGEKKDDNKNRNLENLKNIKKLKISKSALDITGNFSDKAKQLCKKINFHVNKVKKSHEDLTSLNALYLDNSIFIERNKVNNMNNIQQKEDNNYEEALKKKNLRNNFEFMNKNYHRELNLAFLKYNPLIYSNNLKRLLQVSPVIRDDIKKIKLEVEEDIKTIKDKHKLAKLFEKIKIKTTKNARRKNIINNYPSLYKSEKSEETTKSINNTKNIEKGFGARESKNFILPNLLDIKNTKNRRESNIKYGFIKKLKNMESKKFLDSVDQQFDNMTRLHNISKEIEKYIDIGNVCEKIDNNVHDYTVKKYKSFFEMDNEDKNNSVFKPRDYYYLQKAKINNMFGDLYIKKLKARILEEERNLGNKLRLKKNDYFNKISFDMKKSLGEFDNNIKNNEINLEKNEEKNENILEESFNSSID